MLQLAEQIRTQIESKAGDPVVDVRNFANGNNTALYLIDTQSGDRLVAKVATGKGAKLDLEGWMLKYLARHSSLPVPDVIFCAPEILVMTHVPDCNALSAEAERQAAEAIAALHSVTAPRYGLERDTQIGPLHQPNTQEDDWLTFFREHRLLYMAGAALEEGKIDTGLMRQIERLAGRMADFIETPARPALLHGDLWGGNVLATPEKLQGFIDPAIYYGDPEIELAFSTLFGTFGDAFFNRYNEIIPLRPGFFEVRRDLYNLYPLLVHVRIFGAAYVPAIQQTVKRLAA